MKVKRKLFLTGFILFIIFAFIVFLNNKSGNNNIYKSEEVPNHFNDYSYYVTDNSENNPSLVSFISQGMNLEDFKSIFQRTSHYIVNNDRYKEITYDFDKHLTYEKLEDIYFALNDSDVVKLEVIGKSFDERNIYSIEIGKGTEVTMFEGNIHAAEIAPALYLTKLAVDLVNAYEQKNEDIVNILNNHKIVIVPSANPDGYDYSIFGREKIRNKSSYAYINDYDIDPYYYKANINGVDLNRNFPSQLSGLYFNDNGLSDFVATNKNTKLYEYFPGDMLGSEPETKALMYWIYNIYDKKICNQ